jgi:Sulfotransferase family
MTMLYALGQALEHAADFSGSFAAYEEGASLSEELAAQAGNTHDRAEFAERVRRRKMIFTAANLAARRTPPDPAMHGATPIFIVGMPRAGSTLVEQILASHSQVEATLELPVLGEIIEDLSISRVLVAPDAYPECVPNLTARQLAALGERYIEGARAYRKTDRPCFIDKLPLNWLDVGLIHLILPHAKIIDIRRAPMAACFAMFKQILSKEASFSNDLGDLGHFYNEYVAMMLHYETVLPGRVHGLSYERLVEDTETEIRRLLEYCGLAFEPACLRFWENDRAVATPSAAQVRRPIFRDALLQWRNYERFLGPLQAALDAGLGPAADPSRDSGPRPMGP